MATKPAAPTPGPAATTIQPLPPVTEPPPPPPAVQPAPPRPPAARQAISGSEALGAFLATVGGAAMVLITLYATVYRPLHFHEPVNYGEPVQFGDLLAIGSGLIAIAVGAANFRGKMRSPARGVVLALCGAPTLLLALLWSFPETFHLDLFSRPFYFGVVYFSDLGNTQIGTGNVPLPLVVATLMVIVAAVMVSIPSNSSGPAPPPLPPPPPPPPSGR